MKDLVFSISFKNHTFIIRTTPRSTQCYYDSEGKYTTSLIFASNTYASVKYKNVSFHGSVTKHNIWHVNLDYKPILKKRYNSYYYLSNDPIQNMEEHEKTTDAATEYPDKVLRLYSQLIELLSENYLCIEDKDTFKDQLCDYLFENYLDEEVEDLDTIIESENWNDVEEDEDPIIEEISLKKYLIKECKDFFICFRQAEIDNKNKKVIVTLENVIIETPELSQIPRELLQTEFCSFWDKNYADLIKPDIWYYQEELLMSIGDELLEACQYALFINTVEKKIDSILVSMMVDDIDRDELYSYFKFHYDKDCLPSDEEFESDVRAFVNEYVTFNQICKKYVSLFNTNHIKIEWNDEKLFLFQKYDESGQIADSQDHAEYEAYKYVMPFYRKHFFRKNSNRYKPIIEKLPLFTTYATTVLDILFKHEAITDKGDVVVYNADGNIDLAYKEIQTLDSNYS